MYRHCIFCSGELGSNEAVETFPLGRILAFDSWKGRLWVVCPACSRWNLTPMEERWEACESAEELFRGARLRAQSENIGLARLADGTRLIRVGKALEGEMAAWRYGAQLVNRRNRYLMITGAVTAGALAVSSGLAVIGAAGLIGSATAVVSTRWQLRQARRVVHHLPAEQSPSGREIHIRRWHVQGAQIGVAEDGGGLALSVWDVARRDQQRRWGNKLVYYDPFPLVLTGADARIVLGRSMLHVNEKGANRRKVETAIQLLARSGSAEEYVAEVARERGVLGTRELKDTRSRVTHSGTLLDDHRRLALEMALHEETERRALEGELSLLESAWRAAEEIAAIADVLPDDPLDRLRGVGWGSRRGG